MLLIYFYRMYKNIGIVDNHFSQRIEIRPKPIIGNLETPSRNFLYKATSYLKTYRLLFTLKDTNGSEAKRRYVMLRNEIELLCKRINCCMALISELFLRYLSLLGRSFESWHSDQRTKLFHILKDSFSPFKGVLTDTSLFLISLVSWHIFPCVLPGRCRLWLAGVIDSCAPSGHY